MSFIFEFGLNLPPWKWQLQPASFRGAGFKVDTNVRASGRRSVLHEFPHRDIPYTEDLGRKAIGFSITGYVIGPFYKDDRDELIYALEQEGPGQLILPTLGQLIVQPREYSVRENKRAGGVAEFEMNFIEAGNAGFDTIGDTASQVLSSATNLKTDTVASSNNDLVPLPTPRPSGISV
jgi:prophage DNA circulation protein